MDDRELFTRSKQGDHDAFETLVARHERRIYGICSRMLSGEDEARDVTQEVFLVAWKERDRFRGEAAVFTWLYRIAVNLSLRRRRGFGRLRRALSRLLEASQSGARNARPAGSESDGLAPPGAVPGWSEAHQDRAVEASDARAVLERAFERLDPSLRAAVLLRDRDGLDYAEISAALGWPLGTVKSRLSRARGVLADEVSRLAPELVPADRTRG